MRNAEEHKKLLEQITELEKNSVNYFDVEKEFFLIDSENLSQVQTRFYGYSIQADGIYEEDNLTEAAVAGLDGRGCYVYVEVKDGQITIKQDLNGCWGIYLFRHGDYFALSNSFFRLVDYIKFRYPLTVNRDYCHYLMVDFVAVQSYSATAVNEIQIIDRSIVIHIDTKKKSLELEMIDNKEHSVPLDSAEGVAIMDRWVEFWGNVLRGVAQHTKFLQADLTGGFDTRINFVPLLHSGIDLNGIQVYSIKNDLNPTFKEDYDIASEIAEHYGFKLNQQLPARPAFNYSLEDVWNSNVHCKQTFSNLAKFPREQAVDKMYRYVGVSSEVFRKTWHMSPQKFIDAQCARTKKRYSVSLSQKLAKSMQAIIESVFRSVRDKYHIADPNSVDIPQYLYHDTRSRTHCGKATATDYLRNTLNIVPAYDREMQTLQLKTSRCPDYNLLMVLLFTRYAPDLLKIRFDKFHEPPDLENLIPYAKEINERFPICHKKTDNLNGGGRNKSFIYSRVTYKPRKSSLKVKITQTFSAICQGLT